MKQVMLLIMLITSFSASAAIYQWTDEQGITHFSDSENKSAQATEVEVELTPPSITSLTQASAKSNTHISTSENPHDPDKQLTVSITSPSDQATVRNNNGEIQVSAALNTALLYSQKFRLLIDGHTAAEQIDNAFKVEQIPPGSHTLQLQVINNLGKVIASSEIITVYLHRFQLRKPKPQPKQN
jgi:hypothetical protein